VENGARRERPSPPDGNRRRRARPDGDGGPPREGLQVARPTLRVAVVTGASSGIGAELVRRLQARGTHVVGLSRRHSSADEHVECDVGDRAAVEAAAAAVLERHPRIDLLVANAGIGARADFLDGDAEAIERTVRVNYLGAVWTVRAFERGLQPGARVVNVCSVAGTVAVGPYSASKHAQLAFSRSLAYELGRRGISVLTVNPGFVETPGFPQRGSRFGPLLGRLVVDPPFVAGRILAAVDDDRREIVVPRWYRAASLAQALAPGLFARVLTRVPVRTSL
jgi:NAD(P)-dependent dehydrogenase (short-subunit alcohol dehydrogenase family)